MGAKEGDFEAARAKEAEVAGTVALFESLVAGNGTILGTFTIADCCAAPVTLPHDEHEDGHDAVSEAAALPRDGRRPATRSAPRAPSSSSDGPLRQTRVSPAR